MSWSTARAVKVNWSGEYGGSGQFIDPEAEPAGLWVTDAVQPFERLFIPWHEISSVVITEHTDDNEEQP